MPNNTPQHCALLSYNLHVCPAMCTLVLQFAHMSYNVCACPTVCARVLEFAPMSLELWTHAQSGTRAQNGTYDHKLSLIVNVNQRMHMQYTIIINSESI